MKFCLHGPRHGGPHGRLGPCPGRHSHHHGGGESDSEFFTRHRRFSADDLQWLLLVLLERKPAHGYELIKAVGQLSNGYYTPSPGVVYPALTYLEETGLVDGASEGNRKCYQLAEAGRTRLSTEREQADFVLARLTHMGRKLDAIRRTMAGDTADGEDGWLPEYVDARHALKHALIRTAGAGAASQRRIAAILQRAVQEINQEGDAT